jgi:hypothetical protein
MTLICIQNDPDTYHRVKGYQGRNSVTHCGLTVPLSNTRRPRTNGRGLACPECYAQYKANLGKPPVQETEAAYE